MESRVHAEIFTSIQLQHFHQFAAISPYYNSNARNSFSSSPNDSVFFSDAPINIDITFYLLILILNDSDYIALLLFLE